MIFFSAAAFTVSVPAVVTYSSTGGFPVNVVSTTYNKWATLPYLQLTGINTQDILALGGLILFTLLAFQLRTVSFTPIKRSEWKCHGVYRFLQESETWKFKKKSNTLPYKSNGSNVQMPNMSKEISTESLCQYS